MNTSQNRTRRAIGIAIYASISLVALLSPFDFHRAAVPDLQAAQVHPIELIQSWGHFLLFVPAGAWMRVRLSGARPTTVLAWSAGAVGVALAAEAVQVFVSRSLSATDAVANLAGCLAGAAASPWLVLAVRPRPARPWALAAALAALGGGALWLWIPTRGALGSWDAAFPLLLGNERTGDRPWYGTIREVSVLDRALTDDDAEAWSRGSSPRDDEPAFRDPVARFDFSPSDVELDGGRVSAVRTSAGSAVPIRLEGRGPGAATLVPGGVALGPGSMFETTTPPKELYGRLAAAGEYSIRVRCVVPDRSAEGPARIVSLSSSPHARNFTMAQERGRLVVRSRLSRADRNGMFSELVTRDLLVPGRPVAAVVTFDGTTLRLFVDGTLRVQGEETRLARAAAVLFGINSPAAARSAFPVAAWCAAAATTFVLWPAPDRPVRREVVAGILAGLWLAAIRVVTLVVGHG